MGILSKIRSALSKSDAYVEPGIVAKARMIEKASHSPVAVGPLSGDVVRDGMFKHVIDQRAMALSVHNNWMLGAAVDKIVTESTKNIGPLRELFVEKFEKKCSDCGEEHQYDVDECDQCGCTKLRKPDPGQLGRALALFDHPNEDDNGTVTQTFEEILRTLIYYSQVTDDFYLEVLYDMAGNPAELYALSAEYIRIAAKVPGSKWLGRFCELCFEPGKSEKLYGDEELSCPECGRELVNTAYVQLGDVDKVIARFSSRRVLHDAARSFGRRVYGVSKIESVWAAAQILRWMELYQWSTYSNNKSINSILYIPQLSQEEIYEIQDQILERKRLNPGTPQHLWIGGGGKQGSGQPAVIDAMPTMVDLNAKEMATFLREAIAIRYGVSLNMLGVQTPGKLGQETEQVEVSYDTIEEVQTRIEEFFNNKLLPLFRVTPLEGGRTEPEIQDWIFELPNPQRDDLLRKEEIESRRVQKAQLLEQMGYEIEFDDEFNVRLGERKEKPQQTPSQGFPAAQSQPGGNLSERLRSLKPGESMEIGPDGTIQD